MLRHLAAFAAALAVAGVRPAAAEPDVTGSWQANIDCGLNATATSSIAIAADSATGALTGQFNGPSTFQVPNAIRRISGGHNVPDPFPVQVTGPSFALPATGFLGSDATVPAVPLFSCSAATEIVSASRVTGTITSDGDGRATLIAGTWEVGMVDARDATGTTCWSVSPAGSCTFEMRRNGLPVGDDVTVSPRNGASVTFEHVTAPGIAAVMPVTDADGGVPAHFQVLGAGNVPIFYDVLTTATFEGTVTTCFAYPDENGDGLIDGTSPPLDETALRVLHEEDGTFVDRTVRLDTVAKVICGATTSLSELALARVPGGPYLDHPSRGGTLVLRRRRSGRELARFAAPLWNDSPLLRGSTLDPREAGAVLELLSAADGAVGRLVMPASHWRPSRDGRVFRFRDRGAPDSTSPVASAVLDYGRHRVEITGRAVGLPLDGPQRAVGVRLSLGWSRWCFVEHARDARRDGANHFVGVRGPDFVPGDCADRRMWFALGR